MIRFLLVTSLVALFSLAAVAAPADAPKSEKPSAPAEKAPSAAGEKPSEPRVVGSVDLAKLVVGMRVRLTLRYGRPIVGTVAALTKDSVTIDLSSEPGGLPGKFTFKTADVAEAAQLVAQSEEEKQQVRERQKEASARIDAEVRARAEKRKEEQRKKEDLTGTRERAQDVMLKKDEEQQMRALLEEFPPGEGWGEDKAREIRERWLLLKIMPTDKEMRFADLFDDWRRARDAIAAVDAERKVEQGKTLLLRFPPSKGWGRDRLAEILAKEAGGQTLSDEEARFKEGYEAWSDALAQQGGTPATKPAAKTPATEEKPAEEKPAEPKPETEKPAEVKPAADTPAPVKPAEEKTTPPDAPAAHD